ncbi:hypothetical protein [Bacteriovorax sp. Seq25_V]|uniref:hypothetical protein n=1 Tax=Bacteriovorax sp. Seq25_V TaxID=1201288 RepID=UPI000389DC79|nr:hypothetical protein [Bacteriovorax sp. Seq25_V]EQC47106.1 putative lipoprotein [Bacteriovorax sp. Seq25_V]
MKILNILFILISLLLTSCSTFIARSPSSIETGKSCTLVIKEFNQNFLEIDKKSFLSYYNALNDTLSGNLATVFRSEWKAKENYGSGSAYLTDLINNFGNGEKINFQGRVGKERIDYFVSLLKEKKHLGFIGMRDPPAPKGSFDRTFTYYTKVITDGTGAKHQVRLRSYVRTLIPAEMPIGEPIRGFIPGSEISITKISPSIFEFTTKNKIQKLNLRQLKKQLGNTLSFYAYPHSKKFKLEVKTRPHDEVLTSDYAKLLGKNYVQKLSVNVSPEDISLLFATNADKDNMTRKLLRLKEKVLKDEKNALERTNIIFKILNEASQNDSEFLFSRGATEYRRYAFEVEIPDQIEGRTVRVQTTFDYEMGVRSTYDSKGNFLTPLEAMKYSTKKSPKSDKEEMHIELKVPKMLVEAAADGNVSQELLNLMKIFNNYNTTNKGKFNHISKERDINE